jgi:LacI family transcriptional regulator
MRNQVPRVPTSSRITIEDVARQAGLSTATVSRVLNQTGPVSDESVQRVQQAVAKLNYVPHLGAKQLASQRTNILGLLLDEISSDFFTPMLKGIEKGALEGGYDLLIATMRGGQEVVGRHNTDGIIVFDQSLNEDRLRRLHAAEFPVVLLYRSSPRGLNIPCVVFENKDGARQMTDHLIEQCGYQRIAFLRGPADNEDSYWRERGYRDGLEAHGIAFNHDLVASGEFDDQAAYSTVKEWLTRGLAVDAIFAGDDESAIGAMAALREAGYRIPQDIAVVGFDDTVESRLATPPLTTVRAPIEKTGYEAAKQLIRLINEGTAEPEILLPVELIVRESCGFGLKKAY